MDFKNKKVFIAPHTPKTTAFKEEFIFQKGVEFKGYIDKIKEGEDIYKPQDIQQDFDYILILSQNHFDSIYAEYKKVFDLKKIIKVEIVDGEYRYLNQTQIKKQQHQNIETKLKRGFLYCFAKFLDFVRYKREGVLFISKSFVGTNNKALFLHCVREGKKVCIATDNVWQYEYLQKDDLSAAWLGSWKSYFYLALSKTIVLDQGNFTYELTLLSKKQKTVQLWHGIPLKRMNKLVGIKYDYLVSTSNFVNETTLGKVIDAVEYKNYGYPRNDLLLKKELKKWDELFCDREILKFVKQNYSLKKIAVYMPTHRESSKNAKIPLDFQSFNEALKKDNTFLIVKLHPFVMQLYKNEAVENYSNILFHSTQGDVYPVLRYCDLLITDYSSIYFDFMLLNRPIIFFDYDRDEYEGNMGGFVYDYEKFTLGQRVKTQQHLVQALQNDKVFDYEILNKKLNDYIDCESSDRICKEVCE